MGNRQRTDLHPDEQAFLAETGLRPDDLAGLVEDAPPLPADTLARIRGRTRVKAGIAAPEMNGDSGPSGAAGIASSMPAAPAASRREPSSPRRRSRRWLAVAAAGLVLVGATAAAASPERAMASIQRLVRLVPGIGLTETGSETWILPEPVSVVQDGVQVTVMGFLSSPEETRLQLSVDWPPWSDQDKNGAGYQITSPELRLRDGTVLRSHRGSASGGSRSLLGDYGYGPLPGGTSELVVIVPHLSDVSGAVRIPLTLVNATEALLTEAHPGNWSEERQGLQVGVPHWVADGDRILVNLAARPPEGVAVTEFGDPFAPDRTVQPRLTDDKGRSYPLVVQESRLRGSRSYAVFQGPLAADAEQLTLMVPSLRLVDQSAEAPFTVPLAELPEGEPVNLNQELQIGSHRFTVSTVTRVDHATFEFALQMGPEEGGVRLQSVGIRRSISPSGAGFSVKADADGLLTTLQVDFRTPPNANLTVIFAEPEYRVLGPWEVKLPVPGDQAQ